jgi:hypothetical protein
MLVQLAFITVANVLHGLPRAPARYAAHLRWRWWFLPHTLPHFFVRCPSGSARFGSFLVLFRLGFVWSRSSSFLQLTGWFSLLTSTYV